MEPHQREQSINVLVDLIKSDEMKERLEKTGVNIIDLKELITELKEEPSITTSDQQAVTTNEQLNDIEDNIEAESDKLFGEKNGDLISGIFTGDYKNEDKDAMIQFIDSQKLSDDKMTELINQLEVLHELKDDNHIQNMFDNTNINDLINELRTKYNIPKTNAEITEQTNEVPTNNLVISEEETKSSCYISYEHLYKTLLQNENEIYAAFTRNNFREIYDLFNKLGIILTKDDKTIYISTIPYKQIMIKCHSDKNRDNIERTDKIIAIVNRLRDIINNLTKPEDIQLLLKGKVDEQLKEEASTTKQLLPGEETSTTQLLSGEVGETLKDTGVSVEDEQLLSGELPKTTETSSKQLLLTGDVEEQEEPQLLPGEEEKIITIEELGDDLKEILNKVPNLDKSVIPVVNQILNGYYVDVYKVAIINLLGKFENIQDKNKLIDILLPKLNEIKEQYKKTNINVLIEKLENMKLPINIDGSIETEHELKSVESSTNDEIVPSTTTQLLLTDEEPKVTTNSDVTEPITVDNQATEELSTNIDATTKELLTSGYDDTNIENIFNKYNVLDNIFRKNDYKDTYKSGLLKAIDEIDTTKKKNLIELLKNRLKDIKTARQTFKMLSDLDSLSANLAKLKETNKSPSRSSSPNSSQSRRLNINKFKGGDIESDEITNNISKFIIKFQRKRKSSKKSKKSSKKKSSKKSKK